MATRLIFCYYFLQVIQHIQSQECGFTNIAKVKSYRGQGLTDFPFRCLKNESFETLDMGNNKLTYLHTKRFFHLPHSNFIKAVLLDNNQLSNFPRKAFHELTYLEELHLENNIRMDVGTQFCHLQSLEFLDLSNMPIKFISQNSFGCLKNLKTLYLVNCSLSVLPENFISGSNIERLDLSGNYITNMYEVNLPTTLRYFGEPEEIPFISDDTSTSTVNSISHTFAVSTELAIKNDHGQEEITEEKSTDKTGSTSALLIILTFAASTELAIKNDHSQEEISEEKSTDKISSTSAPLIILIVLIIVIGIANAIRVTWPIINHRKNRNNGLSISFCKCNRIRPVRTTEEDAEDPNSTL